MTKVRHVSWSSWVEFSKIRLGFQCIPKSGLGDLFLGYCGRSLGNSYYDVSSARAFVA